MNLVLVLVAFSTSVSVVYTYTRTLTPEHAHAATSSNLNFQARLLSANGNTVPDGYYNIEFNLYSVSAGGTSLWTETRDFDGTDDRVRTVNGYLSANLGSVTALPNIDWSQDLWLGMTVRGSATCAFATTCTPADSEMTPRTKLTAVPYALAAGNVRSANTTAASTNSDGVSITTGGTSGATSNTGAINLQSGNSTTSGNTGGISLQSGNATSGNSGNITLDVGTASGTTGTISIGTANTSGITIGKVGVLTRVDGNFTIGASAGSGTQFTNNGSTLNATLSVLNDSDGGSLGGTPGTPLTAAQSVDIYTSVTVNQTTAGQDISLPNPTSAAAGRIMFVLNSGTQSFTMHSVTIPAGYGQLYIWNGANWRLAASGGGAAITLQAGYDGGNSITSTNGRDLSFTSTDTATDANFLMNIATGSTGEFKVQANGTDVLQIGAAGQLQLDVQGNTGGLLIGADANLYRSAADTLRTDDSFVVQGVLSTLRGSDYSATPSLDNFDFGVASLVRLTGASTQTITGIASGTDGRILTIVNAAAQTAYISNDSASSSAGNKIYTGTGGNLALPAGSSITLIYDAGASYWRVVGGAATASSGAGAPFVQGGNSFAANAELGTNDTYSLIFKTDNTNKAQLTTTGDLEFLQASTIQTNAGALTLDSAAALNLGTVDATSVSIGKTGVTTTNNGALTVTQLLTGSLGATISGAAISLNDSSNFNTSINGGTSTGAVNIGNSAAGIISLQSGDATAGAIVINASNAAGGINIDAGTGGIAVDTTGAISLDGAASSNYTVTGSGQNLTLAAAGGGTQQLILQSAGTGANAVYLQASAGGVDIDAATGITLDATTAIGLTSGTTLSLTSTGANNINLTPGGGSNTGVLVKPTTNSTAVFQVQNTANAAVLTVDTSGNKLVLGQSNAVAGSLEFKTSGDTNSVSISTPTTLGASYNLKLPSATPTTGQCIVTSSSDANQLTFGSCFQQVSNATISHVNEWHTNGTNVNTINGSPASQGNMLVLTTGFSANGVNITGISGGGVSSWQRVTEGHSGSGSIRNVEMWRGVVSSPGASTITLTYSGNPGTIDIQVNEFTMGSQFGTWSIDSSGTLFNSASATITYPSLTPSISNQLYTGYSFSQNAPSAGATGGYSYITTAGNGMAAYNPSPTQGAPTQPTGSQSSGTSYTIAAVIQAFTNSNVIVNGIGIQEANFNVKAATSGTVAGVLQANSAGIGHILDLRDGAGNLVGSFDSVGAVLFKNSTNSTTGFEVQNASGVSVFNVDTTNAKIGTRNETAASTNSAVLTVKSGDVSGATSNSGNVVIGSGNATGTSGDINIQVGTGASLGNINIGSVGSSTQASTIHIGDTSNATGTQTISIGSSAKAANSVAINAGSSGGIALSGNTFIANNSSFTIGTGSQFTNNSSTLLTAITNADTATDTDIGTAAATVDIATTINKTQTTAGRTLTLPTPTSTTAGRVVYVNSVAASTQSFIMYGVVIAPSTSASFIWNGAAWVATGGGSGVNNIGAVDTTPTNANGARISGSTLYLQYADATYAGLVSTTTQTFAGNKTFTGSIAGQLGLSVTGAAVNLNASSNFDTNINTGTSTGAVNIGNGAAGAVTLQSGTGNDIVLNAGDTIELQDNTNITGTLNVSVNADIAGTLAVGTADALTISAAGLITTADDIAINGGDLTTTVGTFNLLNGATTVNLGSTASARTVNIGTGAAAQTVNIGSSDTTSTTTITAGSGGISLNASAVNSTATTLTLFASPTAINFGTAATDLNIGLTGSGASSIDLSGGSGDSGCTVNGATGDLACSGNVTSTNTSGTVGYWSRNNGTSTLQPATAGDNLTTSGTGTITAAGILNANATGKTAITIADSGAQDSGITIGSGAGSVNLYRGAADQLKSDDALYLSGTGNRLIVGSVASANANYAIDVRTGTIWPQMHFSSSDADSGGYVVSAGADNFFFSGGAAFDPVASLWRAKSTAAGIIGTTSGAVNIFTNTGLTAGNTYSASLRATVDTSGNFILGSNVSGTITKISVNGTGSSNGITLGSEAANAVNLYRSAADTLRTDDTFSVNGNLSIAAASGDITTAGDAAINGGDLTSSAATVNLFNGATPTVINLGSDANAKTIAIGNTTGASGLNLRVGTGNFSLDGVGASTFAVGSSTTTGTISIGGTAQTGTITVGSSSGTNTVAIGNGAGDTTVNISNGNTGGAVNIGAGFTTGTISIGGTGLQTGTISVGSGTGAQIINLGNGSGAKTINIGGSGANVIGIANTQTAGSVSIGAAMTSGTVNIGGTGAQTGTIDLGVGTGAQAINLGTGGTAAKTVTLGNSSVAGSTTTIQGGSTNGILLRADGTNAVRIQSANGGTTVLTADATNTRITIGAATTTLSTSNLTVSDVEVTTRLRIGTTTNGISFNDGTATKLRFTGTAQNSIAVTLAPEFAGAVLTGDGSANVGTMTSDFCSGSGRLNLNPGVCTTASEDHNYYSWTASATNDYEVFTKWQVPSDFAGFDTTAVQFNGWRTSSSAGTAVMLVIYKADGTTCGTQTSITNTTTWSPTTYTIGACTVTAGEVLTFRVSLSVGVNGEYARIGEMYINYKSQF